MPSNTPELKQQKRNKKKYPSDFLKTVPLFSDLKEAEFEKLLKITREKNYPKNNVIFQEGDPGDALYVVTQGKVKVSLFRENGKEAILDILSNGDYFGEMSLLDGKTRSAYVITIDNSSFLVIYRNDFLSLIKENPPIALKLLEHLSLILRKTDRKIRSLFLLDISGRIANVLIDLAGIKPSNQKKEIYTLDMPTQQELASMIGVSREAVNRALKEMTLEGYIKIAGNKLILGENISTLID